MPETLEKTAIETIAEVKPESREAQEIIPPLVAPVTEKEIHIQKTNIPKHEKRVTQVAFVDNIDNDNEVRKTTSVVEEDISFFDMIK
jgi:hypothetical protein